MDIEYKDYKIVSDSKFIMKVIKPIGRGSIPKELEGLYTNAAQAQRAIDLYLANKEKPSGKAAKSR